MRKRFLKGSVLLMVSIVLMLAVAGCTSPASASGQHSSANDPDSGLTYQGTTVRPETLSSLEEAQKKVDFPIMVTSYLPENMKLAKRGICYQGVLGPSPRISLEYQDLSDFRKGDIESVKSISLHQRRAGEVDIERIKQECEDEYVEGKKYYAEVEIQGATAFWTPHGLWTCKELGDKSTCHLNSKYIRVNWWANGVRYTIIAHNVPSKEVLAFAKSLAYLK
jgi:hypothetical protein